MVDMNWNRVCVFVLDREVNSCGNGEHLQEPAGRGRGEAIYPVTLGKLPRDAKRDTAGCRLNAPMDKRGKCNECAAPPSITLKEKYAIGIPCGRASPIPIPFASSIF